ncbi:MAG: helix-turn-helix domain-containing protein [Candidatus Doudnabacteria bacterium]|nr:helix-turn-helix domain-containing protein [Candidatus Doudnabacteria bacterium]
MEKTYLSVKELADILKISRIAVFKKIKNGQIKAERVGRNYAIPKAHVEGLIQTTFHSKLNEEIKTSVERVLKEYGETLKLLGKE